MIYLIDDSVKDFGSAFKKIDKSDIAWSFVEGLNPFKVSRGNLEWLLRNNWILERWVSS